MMQGYKTMIVAAVSLLGGVATMLGVGIPAETLASLTDSITILVGGGMTLYGAVMAILRIFTKTPLAKKDDGTSNSQSGSVLINLLLTLAICASVLFLPGCMNAPPKTKNEAHALSYYTIGQAYDAVGAARARKEITLETARALDRKVDLSLQLFDLSRDPTSKASYLALKSTVGELEQATKDGKPLLSAAQLDIAKRALDVAEQATGGGPLPDKGDTAAWLMLGSDVLRAVSAATPVK